MVCVFTLKPKIQFIDRTKQKKTLIYNKQQNTLENVSISES